MEDGTVIPADVVVISAGVRANTALAKDAGIAVEKAIVVNACCETNQPGIYACGDCAEFLGVNFAIWPEASEMGKVAGANAAGDSLQYQNPVPGMTMNAMNTSLFVIGDNGSKPDKAYKTVEFKDDAKGTYEKYYFLNNAICGVTLIGSLARMAEMTAAIEERKNFKEIFG